MQYRNRGSRFTWGRDVVELERLGLLKGLGVSKKRWSLTEAGARYIGVWPVPLARMAARKWCSRVRAGEKASVRRVRVQVDAYEVFERPKLVWDGEELDVLE